MKKNKLLIILVYYCLFLNIGLKFKNINHNKKSRVTNKYGFRVVQKCVKKMGVYLN